mmetsp:Transcript_6537/g.16007  ORF Transcript_6537/g.16007 Transcript_6537/m.16007 type:complete len:316 (+) Transcript_6537:61-1008(+)
MGVKFKYTKRDILDRIDHHSRSPCYSVPRSTRPKNGSAVLTSADHLAPGQYRIESIWPMKESRDIQTGHLTNASSPIKVSFQIDKKTDSDGVLKGVRGLQPCTKLGPGQYGVAFIDGTEVAQRVRHQSVPAYSIPRGPAQEKVREDQLTKQLAGGQPGLYKIEAMCPLGFREVREGWLTTADNAPEIGFTKESRALPDGTLKGINWSNSANPGIGPGTYDVSHFDGVEVRHRVCLASTPAWTLQKQVPEGTAKLPRVVSSSPGPGAYQCDNPFEKANAKRQKSFEKLVHMEEQRRRRYLDKMRAEYGADYRMSIC